MCLYPSPHVEMPGVEGVCREGTVMEGLLSTSVSDLSRRAGVVAYGAGRGGGDRCWGIAVVLVGYKASSGPLVEGYAGVRCSRPRLLMMRRPQIGHRFPC